MEPPMLTESDCSGGRKKGNPPDADFPVAFWFRGANGSRDRETRAEILVAFRALLFDFIVDHFERDEVAELIQQSLLRKQPFDQRFHRAGRAFHYVTPVNAFPRRKPFPWCPPHPVQSRTHRVWRVVISPAHHAAVRNDHDRVVVGQLRNTGLVMLHLIERSQRVCLLLVRILQPEQHKGKSVQINDDVWPPVVCAANGQRRQRESNGALRDWMIAKSYSRSVAKRRSPLRQNFGNSPSR